MGLCVCLLLVLVIVISRWWTLRWGYDHHWGYIERGGLGLGYHQGFRPLDWSWHPTAQPAYTQLWFGFSSTPREWVLVLPLWVPIAVVGGLLVWSWRRGRRRPDPVACRNCGYNLKGNVSGICPECGTPRTARIKRPG